jgi:hypothetical protein
VDHAIGLDLEHVIERLLARRESPVVIGAVDRGAAVVADPALLESGLDVRKALGPAKHQVLEQMRHPGLAVAFLPRADEIGDVDRHGVDRTVRDEQDPEAVRQAVLGDALDRRDALNPRGEAHARGLGGGEPGQEQDRRKEKAEEGHRWHACS